MKSQRTSSPVGQMMIFEGSILFVPLLLLPFFPEESSLAWMFLFPGILAIMLGLMCCYLKIPVKNNNRFVVFVWFFGILLGAIPFLLWDSSIGFVNALFESVSGFTTTGLSVLNVEQLPNLFLFYRSFIQYVGGLGFIMTILLFVQEKNSMDLYTAEGHLDRIMPNIGGTVKIILKQYGIFLLAGTIALGLSGMPIFDSLLHAMCALSTGGFSNRMASIGYYDSLAIELVTCVLMLIGTTNFSLLLLLFKGKPKEIIKSSEYLLMGLLLLLGVPVMILSFHLEGSSLADSLRSSLFNAFSAISTTGYATSDYGTWPELSIAVMILFMLIGGGMGSTAGGIKLGRIYILLKAWIYHIRKNIFSEHAVTLLYYKKGLRKEIITREQIEEAFTYSTTYFILYLLGTVFFCICSQAPLLDCAFEFASSIGTVGLSIGLTNTDLPTSCLILEMLGMLLGRLEIFALCKAFCNKIKLRS